MARPEILARFIRSWEGGFVDSLYDKGGPTMMGVTLGTFRTIFGSKMGVDELKHLTDAQWWTVFYDNFWKPCKADDINCQAIANLIVDWCWGSGQRVIYKVQRVLNEHFEAALKTDSILGAKTLAAINEAEPSALFAALWKERKLHFERIASIDHNQRRNLRGWLNRLNSIRYDRLLLNKYRKKGMLRYRRIVKWPDGQIIEGWGAR